VGLAGVAGRQPVALSPVAGTWLSAGPERLPLPCQRDGTQSTPARCVTHGQSPGTSDLPVQNRLESGLGRTWGQRQLCHVLGQGGWCRGTSRAGGPAASDVHSPVTLCCALLGLQDLVTHPVLSQREKQKADKYTNFNRIFWIQFPCNLCGSMKW